MAGLKFKHRIFKNKGKSQNPLKKIRVLFCLFIILRIIFNLHVFVSMIRLSLEGLSFEKVCCKTAVSSLSDVHEIKNGEENSLA